MTWNDTGGADEVWSSIRAKRFEVESVVVCWVLGLVLGWVRVRQEWRSIFPVLVGHGIGCWLMEAFSVGFAGEIHVVVCWSEDCQVG